MRISRLTAINKIPILQPRWKDRVVLPACYKIGTHNEIVFTKTPSMPGSYYISGAKASKYPKQTNGKLLCYAIPLDELEPLERI